MQDAATAERIRQKYRSLDVQEYTFEEMKAIVDVAKTWNTYVAAHIFTDAANRTPRRPRWIER